MNPAFMLKMIAVTEQLCIPGRRFIRQRGMGRLPEAQANCEIIQ
ncbi:MAG: hypothetical protein JWR69_873 [Pedosphaera sp.]|nr:hypothetical protein [Pedosphaera sp.]